jgi:hypothetical protein
LRKEEVQEAGHQDRNKRNNISAYNLDIYVSLRFSYSRVSNQIVFYVKVKSSLFSAAVFPNGSEHKRSVRKFH